MRWCRYGSQCQKVRKGRCTFRHHLVCQLGFACSNPTCCLDHYDPYDQPHSPQSPVTHHQPAFLWQSVVRFMTPLDWFAWRSCSRQLHFMNSTRHLQFTSTCTFFLRRPNTLRQCAVHCLAPYIQILKVRYGCLNALLECADPFVGLQQLYILVPFFEDDVGDGKKFVPREEWPRIVTIHERFPFCKLSFLDNGDRYTGEPIHEENEEICDSMNFYWEDPTHLRVQCIAAYGQVYFCLSNLLAHFPELVNLALHNVELSEDVVSHAKLQTLRLVNVRDYYGPTKWKLPELHEVVVDCTCHFEAKEVIAWPWYGHPRSTILSIPGALLRVTGPCLHK